MIVCFGVLKDFFFRGFPFASASTGVLYPISASLLSWCFGVRNEELILLLLFDGVVNPPDGTLGLRSGVSIWYGTDSA